jgi:ribosome modulation factor
MIQRLELRDRAHFRGSSPSGVSRTRYTPLNLIFPSTAIAGVHSGVISSILVPLSENIVVSRTRQLRREVIEYDETGQQTGIRRETVKRTAFLGEKQVPHVLTILSVRQVAIAQGLDNGITLKDARACGFRTTTELRSDWLSRHPRQPLAQLVGFALGDIRDRPRFIAWTGGFGDYTGSRHLAADENEALSAEDLNRLIAKQKDILANAKRGKAQEELSWADRWRAIEQSGRAKDVQRERKIIEDRAIQLLRSAGSETN